METFRATLAPARQSCAIIRKIKFVRLFFFVELAKWFYNFIAACAKSIHEYTHSLRHADMVKTNENEWSAGCQFGGLYR